MLVPFDRRRQGLLTLALAAPLVLAACAPAGSPATGPTAAPTTRAAAPAAAPTVPATLATAATATTVPPVAATVRVGALSPSTNGHAGLLIAEEKGWFREQGIEIEPFPARNSNELVAPLSQNRLDATQFSISAGFLNAVARGVNLVVVADSGSALPGHGTGGLVMRKDLVDSGHFRGPADLRGMSISLSTTGFSPEFALVQLLKQGGLTIGDMELVNMPQPDAIAALANRSIDGTGNAEPVLTEIVERGHGVLYQTTDQYSPGLQAQVLTFSPEFSQNIAVANRFVTAYLRGVRLYNDAFHHRDPAARAEVIPILTRRTAVSSPALYDKMVMVGLNPNGAVNVENIKAQQEYYLAAGQQQQAVDVDALVNTRFVEAALQTLGEYRP
jgi:NitT/TauT family transport system substrate-binding protein